MWESCSRSRIIQKWHHQYPPERSLQDYCITLTTRNSIQINTSRQYMLKLTRVSTDWHVSHVFMVHTESSIFVSDVLTLYAHWLVSTSKVITLYIWLPKTEFMSICFLSQLFHLWMWINIIFASDICMHLVKCVKIWPFTIILEFLN